MTDADANAWFSGYTPSLEATVWIGYPNLAFSPPLLPAQFAPWHRTYAYSVAPR